MIIIRPARQNDQDALLVLAAQAGFGLTTFPHDRDLLKSKLSRSLRSFWRMEEDACPDSVVAEPLGGESFMFVAEDLESQKVVGTSSIVSKVGGFQPFYNYRVEKSVHHSDILNVHKEICTLHLVADHNGPAEIGGLFLSPDFRREQNGRVLSLSRFLFMAQHRSCFDPVVVAELRGVIDENGQSPFWNALGRHFFDVELPKADYLSGVDKRFIADLMPKHPIYIPLLPIEAQNVIGKVHEKTQPALKLLKDEGFTDAGMVDIFDAGPTLKCKITEIRSVKWSRVGVVSKIENISEGVISLMSTTTGEFCACRGMLQIDTGEQVVVDEIAAAALRIDIGQSIRHVPIKD